MRDTDNIVEKIGVEKARQKLKTSGLVLAVFDSTQELDSEDISLISLIKDCPAVAVVNKTDGENRLDINYLNSHIENVVSISAKNGDGIEALVRTIEKITGTASFDPSVATLANERQRDCAVKALEAVNDAIAALDMGFTLDAVTVSIEDAVQNILEITGERASEVVVHKVFSRFCVGK